jgi:hypothetical protein
MFRRILRGDYKFLSPYWDHISENARSAVSALMVLQPARRLSAEDTLKHAWVAGHAASTRHMPETHKWLKEFDARRKFKAGVRTVQAGLRLGNSR